MADDCKSGCIDCFTVQAYIASAELREKQIAELKDEVHTWKEASSANSYKAFHAQEEIKTLSQHIVELQNDKGELTDKCRELEVQIEKLKCCGNCKNEGDYKEPYRYGTGWCNICKRHKVAKGNFDKWEIKKND